MADETRQPLIEFPAVYTFKVMGRQEDDFSEFVRGLFHRALGQEISPDSIHAQPSKEGRYVSLNVTVYLLSEEQRVRVYGLLHQEKQRVLYYL